ncbi:MAG: biotin-dependent carboxyltransferase family protein [Sulfurospirillaceae bacterium]|nr:biotin-dependent carboxyltransferase family protein [Sulfurospirillaceae bacterium]
MSSFKVLAGGLLSLIEDFGRFGLCDKGISNSGVMDEYAYQIANNLLQNPPNTNCIEITLGGLKLECDDSCTISVTGADAKFSINSQEVGIWRTHNIKKGDILEFKFAKEGVRSYLCVKGGFNIAKELGSNSTTVKEGIGGLNGTGLQKDDILEFTQTKIQSYNTLFKHDLVPVYEDNLTLRVVLGYQDSYFDDQEIEKFFSQTYTISPENNRMGYKLKSEPIACQIDGIISEGISFGAIQIPKDGQPIILLKDRQTIGGYPKIGSVLPIDCFKLAQMKTGSTLRFEKIGIKDAQNKMKKFYDSLKF